MSEGLNRLFSWQKDLFLRFNVLDVQSELTSEQALQITDNGVQFFDLRHRTQPGGQRTVEVIPFKLRADATHIEKLSLKASTSESNKLKAYWLCWDRDGTTEITLDDQADYFFTSQLDGCRIVAKEGGGGGKVTVAHISGHFTKKQRAEETTRFVGTQSARRLSSTGAYDGQPAYSNYDPDVVYANVVGFRTKWPGCTQSWKLYYQIVKDVNKNNSSNAVAYRIARCRRMYP